MGWVVIKACWTLKLYGLIYTSQSACLIAQASCSSGRSSHSVGRFELQQGRLRRLLELKSIDFPLPCFHEWGCQEIGFHSQYPCSQYPCSGVSSWGVSSTLLRHLQAINRTVYKPHYSVLCNFKNPCIDHISLTVTSCHVVNKNIYIKYIYINYGILGNALLKVYHKANKTVSQICHSTRHILS